MAEVIDLFGVMTEDANKAAPGKPTQPGAAGPTQNRKSGPKASDADARAIQTMLVEYKLPVSKKDPLTPDGHYGQITHDSLKKFVNATHTDPKVSYKANSIKSLMTDKWQDMLPKLTEVASVLKMEVDGPATPGTTSTEEPEVYNVMIEINGEKVRFPIMAALRTPDHLLYELDRFGLIGESDPPEVKKRRLKDAHTLLSKATPESWNGVRAKLSSFIIHLINTLVASEMSDVSQKGKKMSLLIDWLDARFNSIMVNIPESRYPAITRFIYTLDPTMVTSPNVDALIRNLSSLQSRSSQIHRQLVIEMRNAPMPTRQPERQRVAPPTPAPRQTTYTGQGVSAPFLPESNSNIPPRRE